MADHHHHRVISNFGTVINGGAPPSPPVIQTVQGDLPASYAFLEGVSFDFTAIGGSGNYTWSIESGALPDQLVIDDSGADPNDGHMHQTNIDVADDYTILLRCTDDVTGLYDEKSFTITTTAPTLPTGAKLIINAIGQADITAGEYNSLQDSSGNGFDLTYVSGGKAVKSAALQLDGNDTILSVNNGVNDGSLYRSAVGIDLAGDLFPNAGVGTIITVLAPQAYKHFFTSVDFVFGGSTTSFRLGFNNVTNLVNSQSNSISALSAAALTLNTYYVLTERFNATNMRSQVDNLTEVTAAGDARVALTERVQFFFNSGDAGCFKGYLAYSIWFPTVLSDADVLKVKTYLRYLFPSLLGGL